jgi:hypothetical protein
MKVFVDDLRQAPPGWVLARTITEAIRMLDDFAVDEVSLDHDIVFVDERGVFTGKHAAEDFSPVARFIRALPSEKRPTVVRIHTANPIGAIRLESILKGFVDNVERDYAFASEWNVADRNPDY